MKHVLLLSHGFPLGSSHLRVREASLGVNEGVKDCMGRVSCPVFPGYAWYPLQHWLIITLDL